MICSISHLCLHLTATVCLLTRGCTSLGFWYNRSPRLASFRYHSSLCLTGSLKLGRPGLTSFLSHSANSSASVHSVVVTGPHGHQTHCNVTVKPVHTSQTRGGRRGGTGLDAPVTEVSCKPSVRFSSVTRTPGQTP